MVIYLTYYYTRPMERIDPRISDAIRLIAEVTGLTERQAGEKILPSLEGCDLSSRFVSNFQNLNDNGQNISQGNVVLFRNGVS